MNDYNFLIPNMNLEVEIPSLYTLGPGEREIYDYPAEIKTHSPFPGRKQRGNVLYKQFYLHALQRHPLTIAKPVIGGVQTAFVVGPEGEKIHTDAHGRVKVRFHWDREGEKDENSSCWIRVAQMWAGPGWGGLFIPRIGHEVIAGFIEGDPDRPLITGSVYNGNNRPPVLRWMIQRPSATISPWMWAGAGPSLFREAMQASRLPV